MPRRPWARLALPGEAQAQAPLRQHPMPARALDARAPRCVIPASAALRHGANASASASRIARDGAASVPTGMASNPTAPILFDRALLRARMDRARRAGSATFLLDRVREDFEDRLQAVMRNFADVADIWTPGELLRKPLADRFQSITRIDPDQSEALPLQPQSLDLAVSALAFQFVERSTGRAGADPPRAPAGRSVAGGDDRRRYADRASAILCRGGGRMRGRGVAARRAVRRSARCRRAAAARGAGAAGHRRRPRRGALRQRVCADGRSQADGRDQCS